MRLTKKLIMAGATPTGPEGKQGAWNKRQLLTLGVDYPPRKGWLKKLLGTSIPIKRYREFLALSKRNRNGGDVTCTALIRRGSNGAGIVQSSPAPELSLGNAKRLCERCGLNEVYLDIKTMTLCEPCLYQIVQEDQ
jgi:hypothetical protein